MRTRYRNLFFIFTAVTLYGSTGGHGEPLSDSVINMESLISEDEKLITRKGVIGQIAQTLEGVVAITEDILNIILLPIKQLIKLDQKAIINNPYKSDIARVRVGGPLCDEELEFRDKRFPIVKQAQEDFLDMPLGDDDVLEIAFSGSGGGIRAMTYSLGACVGADKIGLLDTVMYMTALSGTTWFLAPWISSDMLLQEYEEIAIEKISQGLELQSITDLSSFFDAFWVKFAFNQHVNAIDIYGALLGNNFLRGFGKKQHMVYLSDQRKIIEKGCYPMPIYTSVFAGKDLPYNWFEFTPFEVGSRWLGSYVPSWSFGRKFKRGKSVSSAPEQSLGYLMGIFGSAFAASFEEMYSMSISGWGLPSFLKGVPEADKIFAAIKKLIGKMAHTDIGDLRIAWGQVFNYVYKMKDFDLRKQQDLKLVDAGIDFNNPVFASYRKPPHGNAPDVIFILDSSSNVGNYPLKECEKYARRNNLKFPIIKGLDADKRTVSVFWDESDPDVPVVVYMPRVVDPYMLAQYMNDPELGTYVNELKNFDIEKATSSGFARTFNLVYSKKQATLLKNLAEFNMRTSADKIKEVLKRRIAVKRVRRCALGRVGETKRRCMIY